MSQSLSKVLVHLIFSTKGRRPMIVPNMQAGLGAYIAGICEGMDSPALLVGSTTDHVHILFSLSRKHALAEVVEHVKKNSSKWMKANGGEADFYWQSGYGAFSVSESVVADVKRYVRAQGEHHRSVSFEDEFRAFLDRHGVAYDERYVWD